MGRVSIWMQWLIVSACVILSPIFVLVTASVVATLPVRRVWPADDGLSQLKHRGENGRFPRPRRE